MLEFTVPMNNLLDTISTIQPERISVGLLIVSLISSAATASILAWFYIRYGKSLSNRYRLANNFVLISVTTTLIIAIVKSSLALSLGLVGALSIVRFRSAIKEPEELAYLFLSIALGLGFGANQYVATFTALIVILVIMYLRQRQKRSQNENFYVHITLPNRSSSPASVKKIITTATLHCTKADVKRVDTAAGNVSIGLYVEFVHPDQLDKTITALQKLSPKADITIIDQSGLVV